MAKYNADKLIGKAMQVSDRLIGHSARKYSSLAENLRNANSMGVKGVPQFSILKAKRLANIEKGRSFKTRVKAGIGLTAIGGGGFLGLHKYHQHKDNKILERIDKMYQKDYTQGS